MVLLGVTAWSEHCASCLGASVSKGEHVFNMLHQQRAAAGCCKRSRGFVNGSERAAVTAEIETSPLCSELLLQGFNLDQEKQTAPCRYQDLACNAHISPAWLLCSFAIHLQLLNATSLLFPGHKNGQQFPAPGGMRVLCGGQHLRPLLQPGTDELWPCVTSRHEVQCRQLLQSLWCEAVRPTR